jgi:hypothetical protein
MHRACAFDAYGSLFDSASAAARCQDVLGDRLDPLTALWCDKQLQVSTTRNSLCAVAPGGIKNHCFDVVPSAQLPTPR